MSGDLQLVFALCVAITTTAFMVWYSRRPPRRQALAFSELWADWCREVDFIYANWRAHRGDYAAIVSEDHRLMGMLSSGSRDQLSAWKHGTLESRSVASAPGPTHELLLDLDLAALSSGSLESDKDPETLRSTIQDVAAALSAANAESLERLDALAATLRNAAERESVYRFQEAFRDHAASAVALQEAIASTDEESVSAFSARFDRDRASLELAVADAHRTLNRWHSRSAS